MIKSYDQLPIGKYIEILGILEQELSEIDRQAEILAVLNDTTAEDIINLPIIDYKEMAAESRFLEEPVQGRKKRIPNICKIPGYELVPTTDIRKMTTAQYVDFQTFAADTTKNMVEILSCFLIPKGFKYNDGYDIADVQRAIRDNMSVSDVDSIFDFFFARFETSMLGLAIFSRWTIEKMKDYPEREKRMQELRTIERMLKDHLGAG